MCRGIFESLVERANWLHDSRIRINLRSFSALTDNLQTHVNSRPRK
jgi:hypothetical protein